MDNCSQDVYQDIDIEALVNRLSPKMAKRIPRFVYGYFKKILHIDELNSHFRATYDMDAPSFLKESVKFLNLNVQLDKESFEILESLKDQHVVVASNHPYGGPEAIGLMDTLIKYFPDIKLVAQAYLKIVKPLQTCCVFNKKEVRTLMEHVEEKKSVLIYPAGFCSRVLSNGEIYDYVWKPSFIKMAKKLNVPILIVHTYGHLSKRIFRWTRFRKIFKIKTGIESAFLVDEMFRLRGKDLKMTIAQPIPASVFDDRYTLDQWSAKLRQFCFNLRDNPHQVFDPEIEVTLPADPVF
ncbi:MAG: hypothetical protein K6F82_05625 [Sphaerochaetaceae bacterium]|nr:hypothetical protein [Sphaerochaetaceae bacterium]